MKTVGEPARRIRPDLARLHAGHGAPRAPATCGHPADRQPGRQPRPPRASSQYATRHDPFVYFHSIIDTPACQKNVVDLSALPGDLRSEATTPEYSFITPDLCADGHDATCADGTSPGGYEGIDAFLEEWMPRIEASPAYQDRGMILVTFDESESGAEACCGETDRAEHAQQRRHDARAAAAARSAR